VKYKKTGYFGIISKIARIWAYEKYGTEKVVVMRFLSATEKVQLDLCLSLTQSPSQLLITKVSACLFEDKRGRSYGFVGQSKTNEGGAMDSSGSRNHSFEYFINQQHAGDFQKYLAPSANYQHTVHFIFLF
jgi:hypothetical protein